MTLSGAPVKDRAVFGIRTTTILLMVEIGVVVFVELVDG